MWIILKTILCLVLDFQGILFLPHSNFVRGIYSLPPYSQIADLNNTPPEKQHDIHHRGWLHPGRLTWKLQITHLERKMIFPTSMIMFHVNLPGCTHLHVSHQSHQHLRKQGTWVLRTRLSFTFCKRSVKIESSCEVGRNHQNGWNNPSLDIHGHLLRFGIWTPISYPKNIKKTFSEGIFGCTRAYKLAENTWITGVHWIMEATTPFRNGSGAPPPS